MTELTEAEKLALNKRACELLGICWHEFYTIDEEIAIMPCCSKCGKYISKLHYCDFTTDAGKVELLRLMEKYESEEQVHPDDSFLVSVNCGNYGCIPSMLITDTTGLLLKAAVEWMERKKR